MCRIVSESLIYKSPTFRKSRLNGEFSEEIEYGICEVIAVGEGLRALSKPIESVYSSDMKDILKDSLEMWNSQDVNLLFPT